MGVKFNADVWSAPAHAELTPVPMANNAMASMHAAITKVFAIPE
jgi:hypothetical protein